MSVVNHQRCCVRNGGSLSKVKPSRKQVPTTAPMKPVPTAAPIKPLTPGAIGPSGMRGRNDSWDFIPSKLVSKLKFCNLDQVDLPSNLCAVPQQL
eukprot:114525-Amphidinium_carterae.1